MELAAIPWVQGSALTLALAIIMWGVGMVLRGGLIPRPSQEALVKVLEQRITEKTTESDAYKAAWQAAEEARRQQNEQLGELLEYARTTDQVLRALGRRGGRDALAP
ncbi:hypothetical protein ACLQ2R_17220 [Streptosporangium sp. DT93]|uniref:hypothetical protein n=1 Tax=Streptosporangium sp. DT93 TaxID=3393428 RepID=UPI003CF17AAE